MNTKLENMKIFSSPSLPGDLLLEIATFVELRSDLFHFSISSSKLYSNLTPALYASVTLDTFEQCVNTLTMLHRCPEIARHVQKLVLRPNSYCNHERKRQRQGRSEGEGEDGYAVCWFVRQLASKLDALNTFVWDWEGGLPPSDDLWLALRMSCPRLRTIGSSIAGHVLGFSYLFDFRDLLGFSLNFKLNFNHTHMHEMATATSAPSRLWDMLISRCPNLEELSLDGYTTNHIESHRLVCGRWPNLRKLTLGDVIVNLDLGPGPAAGTGGDEKPLSIQFLEAHSNLQTLQISQHALLPRHLSFLSTSSLAHLVKFTGSLEQLQSLAPAQVLPNSRGVSLSHQLQSLAFHEPILLRDVTPVVISSALQGLGNLTMLRIGFLLHSNLLHESGSLLRSITASCPRLERIELGCACGPSFTIESFAKAIQYLRRLRSLSLTLVKFPGEDSVSTNAVLLARTNPRLKHFTVTFIPDNNNAISHLFPLPHSLTVNAYAYVESGTYRLTVDEHGQPVSLAAVERVGRAASWRWLSDLGFSPDSVRRYKIDLWPENGMHGGVWGCVELLVERSKAGEELRMLVTLAVLCWVAIWGFCMAGAVR